MHYYKTSITSVGSEVESLLEGGVLILYAEGAPPELAEVSVLHCVEKKTEQNPPIGSMLRVGAIETVVTALGDTAWSKVSDLGHVVISFNGADIADRPGEICAGKINLDALHAELKIGASIELLS